MDSFSKIEYLLKVIDIVFYDVIEVSPFINRFLGYECLSECATIFVFSV